MSIKSKKGVKQPGSPPFAPASCYAPLVILPTATPPETVQAVRDAGYVPVLTDEPDKFHEPFRYDFDDEAQLADTLKKIGRDLSERASQ